MPKQTTVVETNVIRDVFTITDDDIFVADGTVVEDITAEMFADEIILKYAGRDVRVYPSGHGVYVNFLYKYYWKTNGAWETPTPSPALYFESPYGDRRLAVWPLWGPYHEKDIGPLADALECGLDEPIPIGWDILCADLTVPPNDHAAVDALADHLGVARPVQFVMPRYGPGGVLLPPKPTTSAPAKLDRQGRLDAALAHIAEMEPTSVAQLDEALKLIAALDPEDRETGMQAHKKRTGHGITAIRDSVKALLPKAQAPNKLGFGPDGHSFLYYSAAPNQLEHRAFIRARVKVENNGETKFASSMGTVTYRETDDAGRIKFSPISLTRFNALLADMCSTSYVDENGKPGPPELFHKDFVGVVYERLPEQLPQQPTIHRVPVFRDDKLLSRNGQHGDIVIDCGDLKFDPIPDNITEMEFQKATYLLRNDLLGDFDFDDEIDGLEAHEASEANAIAWIITPFMEAFYKGRTPIFEVNKPNRGAGGSLLSRISPLIYEGDEGETLSYTPDKAEMQKLILAAVRAGRRFPNFDNVREFKNEVILRISTSADITGRILGLSELLTAPNNLFLSFNGIRPVTSPEMDRRIVRCNLDPNTPNNDARIFKHDLAHWIPENRGKLVRAILIIVKYWVQMGKPEYAGTAKLRSFDDWVAKVGGVLDLMELRGYLANPAASVDREVETLDAFAAAWVSELKGDAIGESELRQWTFKAVPGVIYALEDDSEAGFQNWMDSLRGRVWDIKDERWKLTRDAAGWRMVTVDKDAPRPVRMAKPQRW